MNEEVAFSFNTETCECEQFKFCHRNHEHIITGGLHIIDKSKLRKLITKGSNYKELQL